MRCDRLEADDGPAVGSGLVCMRIEFKDRGFEIESVVLGLGQAPRLVRENRDKESGVRIFDRSLGFGRDGVDDGVYAHGVCVWGGWVGVGGVVRCRKDDMEWTILGEWEAVGGRVWCELWVGDTLGGRSGGDRWIETQ
ncbi:hypothetical protein Tco_1253633 [Tanacetum coccineum]